MLTSRAWWLLVILLAMLALGLLASQPVVSAVALALLVWFTGEGVLFAFRAKWAARSLTLRRQVCDDRGVVTSLWAGRIFEVRLRIRLGDNVRIPYLAVNEPVPFGIEIVDGSAEGEGVIDGETDLHLTYKVRAPRPGSVRFEGVRVQLADLHGLFYHVAFLRVQATYRVLPALVDAEGKTATAKRFNLLLPPGIHRLKRPGSGSELLDLRDYLPGDPPKTIAWKVSARRDKLIIKEYESEVPLRCTLFVDTSNSVRLGPPGANALTRLVEIASGVAQANMASRDLTGLCLFDEEKTQIVKPARNRRHLVQLYQQLADAAARPPAAGTSNVEPVLPLAYSFAQEVYPEQLAQGVNQVPAWLPFVHRVPSHWLARPGRGRRLLRGLVLLIVSAIYFAVTLLWWLPAIFDLLDEIPPGFKEELLQREDLPMSYEDLLTVSFITLVCLFYPFLMLFWRDVLPLLFSARRRRQTRMRKKMSALLARRYQLGPGAVELLLQDDGHLGDMLERFLNEHHVPHTPTLFDQQGHYLFASPGKIGVLAAALLRAVGKGHDNELFVLLVDLVELEDRLEPLLRAVRVALARHHQVMVIFPWPPDLDPPGREGDLAPSPPSGEGAGGRGEVRPNPPSPPSLRRKGGALLLGELKNYLKRLAGRRYQKAFHRVRRVFARMQVPVVCADAGDPVQLILDRIDRLRGLRRRR